MDCKQFFLGSDERRDFPAVSSAFVVAMALSHPAITIPEMNDNMSTVITTSTTTGPYAPPPDDLHSYHAPSVGLPRNMGAASAAHTVSSTLSPHSFYPGYPESLGPLPTTVAECGPSPHFQPLSVDELVIEVRRTF